MGAGAGDDVSPGIPKCELSGRDLKAINTFDQPGNVVPKNLDAPNAGALMTFRLPAGSYTVAQMATGG